MGSSSTLSMKASAESTVCNSLAAMTCFRFASPSVQFSITGTFPASMEAYIRMSQSVVEGSMTPIRSPGSSLMSEAKIMSAILNFS